MLKVKAGELPIATLKQTIKNALLNERRLEAKHEK